MLLWNDLINEVHEPEFPQEPSKDDLKLLQIYLCRLFLGPAYANTPVLFNALDEAIEFLGIPPGQDERVKPGTPAFLQTLRKREKALTRGLEDRPSLSFEPLLANLVRLLKPGRVEIKLLVFAILMLRYPKAKRILRELEIHDSGQAIGALGRAMRESSRTLAQALDENALLSHVRLLEAPGHNSDIADLVEAGPLLGKLVDATPEACVDDADDIQQMLFRQICPPGPPAAHVIDDFRGVTNLQLMLDYLQDALASKARGRNILLHGKPGTGKTQLARAMAEKLSAPLYEVPTKDGQYGAMTGRVRLDAAKMAQMFLEDRLGAILLFDEMEDAFRKADHLAKGWFNQLLEENRAPVIWISNNINAVDPAFLRRFDLIVAVEASGSAREARKLQQTLSALPVAPSWVAELSRQAWMTPALARNLAQVGRYLPARQIARNQRRLEDIIRQRLDLMGEQSPVRVHRKHRIPDFPAFRMEWINTRPTLRTIERIVRQEGNARICLYGPPGAGKTAYSEELARRLNRPFMLKSGSDLLGKYVGETEKNIASMFHEAERSNAVLLLDEADAFFYGRSMAQTSWEVSAVNEFMVRLERFEGVFLATTNRFESFDKAILRRLHMKVQFGYLTMEQVKAILVECVVDKERAQDLGTEQLATLNGLTPGLIRAAVQSLRLRGFRPRSGQLIDALEDEQRHQNAGIASKPIGFMQSLARDPV